jgi:hypothetical protein
MCKAGERTDQHAAASEWGWIENGVRERSNVIVERRRSPCEGHASIKRQGRQARRLRRRCRRPQRGDELVVEKVVIGSDMQVIGRASHQLLGVLNL